MTSQREFTPEPKPMDLTIKPTDAIKLSSSFKLSEDPSPFIKQDKYSPVL